MASSSNASQYTVHRCRFVDYTPASITAIAVPPTPLPRIHGKNAQKASPAHASGQPKHGPLAVGRGNGNIELYEWSGTAGADISAQGWVLHKMLYAPTPSKIDTLAFVLSDAHSLRSGQTPLLSDLRLFSAGGGSELLEWDLERGTILRSISSQGGSIWSFAPNPSSTMLALGCEDGGVRLLNVADGALEHVRRLDRVKTRLLSIAWGPPKLPSASPKNSNKRQTDSDSDDDDDDEEEWTDSFVVAGCSDSSLRKWDCATGRVLDRMMVDRNKGERTLVWAVGVLGDGTVVSGDSLGYVKFWDAKTSTQMQSYQLHGADVLALTIGPEGRSVYTAGVDQKINQFSRVQVGSGNTTIERWIHSSDRRYHVHDVRALATWPAYTPLPSSVKQNAPSGRVLAPILISGGLDTTLAMAACALPADKNVQLINPLRTRSSLFDDSTHRWQSYPIHGLVRLAKEARLLMLVRPRGVSLWRLSPVARPSEDQTDMGIRALMDEDEENAQKGGWKKALEMELSVLTNLCAGAISDNGKWLCVADMYETKLFRLEHRGETIKPVRVKTFTAVLLPHVASTSDSEVSTGATAITFSPDSNKLIIATSVSSYVLIVDLGSADDDLDNIRVLRRFDQHRMRDVVLTQNARTTPADSAMDVDEPEPQPPSQENVNVEMQDDDSADNAATVTRISHAVVSPDGQWLATGDVRRRVHVYNLDSIQHHAALPTFETPLSTLVFDPSRPHTLIVVLLNNSFKVFDVETRQFPLWARAVCDAIPRFILEKRDPVQGAAFCPQAAPGAERPGMLLWSREWMCYVELDGAVPAPQPLHAKKRRRSMVHASKPQAEEEDEDAPRVNGNGAAAHESGDESDGERTRRTNFVFLDDKYRSMLFLGFLGDGDMVAVERPFADVLATLPPAYYKQRYGAS
ncbi:WD40 repeat-like protein [Exidia glandulosa HHB12029]|uniref:WD40 repeat-like protein n=1 Tax=Exidia glandulosa HHB12029 TaxID=1314781 RepID=A0A165PDN1_EXIGL|nr:WD40 repeat-like protein [Exidia glandulosa HHB12029]